MRTLLLIVVLFFASTPVFAQKQDVDPKTGAVVGSSSGVSVRYFTRFAIELGGEKLFTVQFTDGGDQTIYAGQGATGSVGILVRPSASIPVSARIGAGFKFVLTAADNANISFTRLPVDASLLINVTPDVHLGAGYVLHLAPRLNGDGFFESVSYNVAQGAMFEVGYRWITAHYTMLSYQEGNRPSIGAGAFGASFTYVFGR